MKKLFLMFLVANVLSYAAVAQADTLVVPKVDKSPLDMSYYPVNFPLLKLQDKVTGPLQARVLYSRPQKNERQVFGNLLEYGKIWRLGANEATEIEFFTPVVINNTKVKPGRYTLFAIPDVNKFTFVLNKDTDVWGSYKYDMAKDVVRMEVPTELTATSAEYCSVFFMDAAKGFNLVAAWDNVKAVLPIKN